MLFIFYSYTAHRRYYNYWFSRGVPGPRPFFPFGNLFSKAINTPQELEVRWATTYGPVYGLYMGLQPTLTVTDPVLVKQILVTDFRCFVDRRSMNSYHPLWNENLFMAEGAAWRRLRAITSPAFSFHKLKTMVPLMEDCVRQLVEHFELLIEASGPKSLATFSAKEIFAGYTIDVICRAAFATKTNANKEKKNAKNGKMTTNAALVENGKRFFNLNPLKIITILALPRPVLDLLNIRQPFRDDTFDYFVDFARAVVRARKEEMVAKVEDGSAKRADLVQLLMDATVEENESVENNPEFSPNSNKTSSRILTDDEVVAQLILFLAAGFETSSASLTFAVFELVNNSGVQEKLYEEVKDESITTDSILNNCPYLEAVLKETTRLYSTVVRLERRVGVDDYQLKEGLILEKGTLVEIPPSALHFNPEFWPRPFTFDPERWMPENAHLLVPYAYLPFGQGNRGCIGQRFAMQEMKLVLARLIRKFRFSKTTSTPVKLDFIIGIPMLNARPFEVAVSAR